MNAARFEAVVETGIGAGAFTIKDNDFDVFLYLSASIAAQALANFYSNLLDSQLPDETTDYEGKAAFWTSNFDNWKELWEGEEGKISPDAGGTKAGQGSWDIHGTTGFKLLTHPARNR